MHLLIRCDHSYYTPSPPLPVPPVPQGSKGLAAWEQDWGGDVSRYKAPALFTLAVYEARFVLRPACHDAALRRAVDGLDEWSECGDTLEFDSIEC